MSTLKVNLVPCDAAKIVKEYVVNEGISTECVDSYSRKSPDGKEIIFLVFEKYFMRNSSRASLSVIVENISGQTIVHSVGSGGGQGFRFDWGTAENFTSLVEAALGDYIG